MKQALTIAALAVGFIAGATALSALAQTGGTWTPPTSTPPGNNVDAPINVGSVTQQKNGWLGVTGLVTANLTVASGTPGLGSILVSDANGNASWQAPGSTSPGDTCNMIATTDYTHRQVPVNVPAICVNGTCSLLLMVVNASNIVDSVTSASLIQIGNTAKTNRGADAYWWSKTGGAHDGTDCGAGRNGTTEGCDKILGSGRNNIGLFDDYTGVETSQDQWTLIDNNDQFHTELYVCK